METMDSNEIEIKISLRYWHRLLRHNNSRSVKVELFFHWHSMRLIWREDFNNAIIVEVKI
jgi:hypothetical protein